MSWRSLHAGVWTELCHSLQGLFNPHNPKTRLAFKAAVATCLALVVALALHLQDPYWAGISAFLVSAEHLGNSVNKTLLRIGCTTVGVAVGILCVHYWIDEPVILLVVTFVILTYTIYRGFRDDQFYLWIFTAITFFMVVTELIVTHNAVATLNLALYRGIDIAVGSLVSLGVGLLLLPNHASQSFPRVYAEFLQSLADYYGQVLDGRVLGGQTQDWPALRASVLARYRTVQQLAGLVDSENRLFERGRGRFKRELERVGQVLQELQAFDSQCTKPDPVYMPRLQVELTQVKTAFQAFLQAPQTQGLPAQQALEQLLAAYDALRRTGLSLQYELADIVVFHELLSLHQFCLDLLTEDDTKPSRVIAPASGHWLDKLRANRLYWLFGGKVALAMLALPLLWVMLAIPGGSQLGVSMGAILNLDFEASRKKGLMRFYGCLVGAALALLVIMVIQVESLPLLLALVFAGAFVFAYLHNSPVSTAYLGTQALVAFLMGTINGFAPTLIPDTAVERLIGIIFGVMFLFVVLEWLWPFSAKERITHYAAQIDVALEQCRQVITRYLHHPDFNAPASWANALALGKRNRAPLTTYVTEDPQLLTLQQQALWKARRLEALEAFLLLVSAHPMVLKPHQAEISNTLVALIDASPAALQAQTERLQTLLLTIRERARHGDFLPVHEAVVWGSVVRKGVVLLGAGSAV